MENYKTQDYTDANDVLTEAKMNAIFEKSPDSKKKEKECFIGKHSRKKDARCCSFLLFVGKCPRIKSMSVPRCRGSLYTL